MEKLIETLRDVQNTAVGDDVAKGLFPDLTQAAVDWSAYCLRNLSGELLRRGLAVSQALQTFDVELRHPETLEDR